MKVGDIVQNLHTGHRYVLTMRFGSQAWIGVNSRSISDPDQWRKVTETERSEL